MNNLQSIRKPIWHTCLLDMFEEASGEVSDRCAERVITSVMRENLDGDLGKFSQSQRESLLETATLILESRFNSWHAGKGNVMQIGESLLRSLNSHDISLWRRFVLHDLSDKRPLRQLNFKKIIRHFENASDGVRGSPDVRQLFLDIIPLLRFSACFSGTLELTEYRVAAERLAGLIAADTDKSDEEQSLERLLAHAVPADCSDLSPEEDALLDDFIEAWVALVDRDFSGEFMPTELDERVRGLRPKARPEVPASAIAHYDLWRLKAEAALNRVQPALTASGYRPPVRIMNFHEFRGNRIPYGGLASLRTFDLDWLRNTRRGVAAWRRGGARTNWNGSLIPFSAPLHDVDVGQQSLALFLWSMRQTKPSAKWRKVASSLARGPAGNQIRDALIGWLGHLTEERIPSQAASGWRMVCRFEGIVRHVRDFVSLFEDAADAALVQYFAPGMKFQLYPDGSDDFGRVTDDPAMLSEGAVTLVRSAIWMLREFGGPDIVRMIRDVGSAAMIRVTSRSTHVGYRSLTVVNAAISALGEIGTVEAVAALGRLRLKVRDERLAKQILQAMEEASRTSNMTVAELEELAAPSCGLQDVGVTRAELGPYTGELSISAAGAVTLTLRDGGGKELKSAPSGLKKDAGALAEWKALKAQQAEIEKALPVEVRRIEATWFSDRMIAFSDWRERYLDHPLVGTLARRLIWLFQDGDRAVALFPVEDGFQKSDGALVAAQSLQGMRVRLWHPLDGEPAEIRRWQTFMMDRRIVQPFKQAHREVYRLTEAERISETYSNRFSGHILRQNQSVALARLRGWRATLRMAADRPNDEATHRVIRDHGLSVEYWTKAAGGDEAEYSENLTYLFIATDRVCFRHLDPETSRYHQGAPIPLAHVPPRVFSEAMRDVDLFVGVASIGNDPEWADGGRNAQHPSAWRRGEAAAYWTRQLRAELDVSGQTRRQFLETLIPMLRISQQCSLDDRYLIVRGARHIYRIHIGSGSVFMENNAYLCIVPDRNGQPKIFLPFEGDEMLSVILSKAFLLANDSDIKDKKILEQL